MNTKILDVENYDFKNSTIIKPPSTNFDLNNPQNRKYTRVVIDSRDRDIINYPSPSTYVVELPDDIQDVVAAELLLADMHLKAPIVQSYNNMIKVKFGAVDVLITIANGSYSNGETIGTAIANKMTSYLVSVGATEFTASYNSDTEKFTFISDIPFSFDFLDVLSNRVPYLGKILGFRHGRTYAATLDISTGKYVLTSEFVKNTQDNTYIVMHIDNFSVNTSSTAILNKSFALLGRSKSAFSQFDSKPVRKDFNPPIPKLSKIRVSFYDYYGNLYDFQNHDHRFELVLESFKTIRKYQSFIPN